MKNTNFGHTIYTGTNLPIVYDVNSELYESKNGESFIHKSGNTYYMYSLVNKRDKQPKRVNLYKVQDIIHLLATIYAEKDKEEYSWVDVETRYRQNLCMYGNLLGEYYTWSLHKLRTYMEAFIPIGWLPIEFWKYRYTKKGFLTAMKAIYFYDDVANALYKYRYGVFKITKLNSLKKDELKKYVLVAGDKLHKLKFDAFESMILFDDNDDDDYEYDDDEDLI